jgi:ESX-1-secreted protein regulator
MGRTSLADRLNHLFAVVRPPGSAGYRNAEVAAETGLSASYIGYLRSGERDNPSMQSLEALAAFFGVSAAYFHDDVAAESVNEQLERLEAVVRLQEVLKRNGVEHLALRMGELSESGIAAITQLVDLLLGDESPA